MNTGIQDAHNLTWKLQLALQNKAKYDALLSTYDTERRPIGKHVGTWSLHNLLSHAGVMDVALGLSENKSVDENKANVASAFDPHHPEYTAKRAAIERAQKVLDTEFKAPGTEIGWFYPTADAGGEGGTLHGGQLAEDGSLSFEFYVPGTIPGHHVPHAWVERDGERRAVRDLVPLDNLLLLARRSGWEGLGDDRVRYEIVGEDGWDDVHGDWARSCGVSEDGAVLVRPDGIVAWRGEPSNMSPEIWSSLIDRILCCPTSSGI